jgi:hypothetical protein
MLRVPRTCWICWRTGLSCLTRFRNHGISGLCGEVYELADRIAPALTRTLAHGKTLVSISERRLHSVLAALEKCRAALLVNADPETAQLLSLAILQLRMKLNRIGDTELKALCDAMTQNEAPLESTQGGRRRSPPVLKLVK